MDKCETAAGAADVKAGLPGPGQAAAVLAAFGGWLAGERGLSAVTVVCYVKQARVFLAALPGPLDAVLRGLDAGTVTSFMLGYCQGRNT
jgi:hypothetical protein